MDGCVGVRIRNFDFEVREETGQGDYDFCSGRGKGTWVLDISQLPIGTSRVKIHSEAPTFKVSGNCMQRVAVPNVHKSHFSNEYEVRFWKRKLSLSLAVAKTYHNIYIFAEESLHNKWGSKYVSLTQEWRGRQISSNFSETQKTGPTHLKHLMVFVHKVRNNYKIWLSFLIL